MLLDPFLVFNKIKKVSLRPTLPPNKLVSLTSLKTIAGLKDLYNVFPYELSVNYHICWEELRWGRM